MQLHTLRKASSQVQLSHQLKLAREDLSVFRLVGIFKVLEDLSSLREALTPEWGKAQEIRRYTAAGPTAFL